jgi:hypothetical protein
MPGKPSVRQRDEEPNVGCIGVRNGREENRDSIDKPGSRGRVVAEAQMIQSIAELVRRNAHLGALLDVRHVCRQDVSANLGNASRLDLGSRPHPMEEHLHR